jgi:hypothetical protein
MWIPHVILYYDEFGGLVLDSVARENNIKNHTKI